MSKALGESQPKSLLKNLDFDRLAYVSEKWLNYFRLRTVNFEKIL